ncbi:MAG: YbaB/EbfC family nucleoid-associated protein [Acidobacteriota bacterium]
MSMDSLLEQAKAMREKQQRELSAMSSRGKSEGGDVVATMDGHKHLRTLQIEPQAIDPERLDQLEQQVLHAVNRATEEMETILVRKFGPSSGIPDLLRGP